MLFHEALRHTLDTFGRSLLQQGRLTNYLADCGVFEPFDERRAICQRLDKHYFRRMHDCLTRSPYKQQYDAIMQEFIATHPQFAPAQVQYIFDSVRFAYGKIKRIKEPQPVFLLPQPKPKKRLSKRQRANTPAAGARALSPRRPQRPFMQTQRATYARPKARPKHRNYQPQTAPLPNTIQWKLLLKSIAFGLGQILLYIVLVYCFIGGFIFLTEDRWYGLICWLVGGIIIYFLHRKFNP